MPSLAPRLDLIQSGQNLAINGAMDFFQRGTSINFAASRLYSADRWCHGRSGGYSGNSNAARSTNVPTFAESGFPFTYSLLVTNGTGLASPGASDFHLPYQYLMEGYDYALIHGKATRYVFWLRSSIAGTYSVAFRNSAGTRSYVTTVTVNSANTWELKKIDMTMDSAAGWTFDNTAGLIVTLAGGVGATFQTANLNTWQTGNYFGATTQTNWAGTTSATLQMTGFMIVQGSFASDADLTFKRAGRTIGDELLMCQRYFYRPGWNTGITGYIYGQCVATGANNANLIIPLPVEMRTSPAVTATAAGNYNFNTFAGAGIGLTAISATTVNNGVGPLVMVLLGTNTVTAGANYLLSAFNSSGTLDFSAEL